MSVTDIAGELPIYNPDSAVGRRESQNLISKAAMNYKLIHLIPLVVIFCFFILWCFSYPVELETKDGRTIFVPIKNKKAQQGSEATDVDLTVLALESPPDDFLSLADGPYASSVLGNQSNVSFLESKDHNAPLTDSNGQNAMSTDDHESNASILVSHELTTPSSVSNESNTSFLVHHVPSVTSSGSREPNELLLDSHEPNVAFSVSQDADLLYPVLHDSRSSSPGISKEAVPQPSGEG
ncbi:uncharacterized protein [Rutidosis leptorrhynchoides]|uniref:uncharacterized protein n=1 Tax=Rutidosis leptorrhynchoides TaxID=125765 RepID=UPI003A99DE9C